MYYEIWAKFDPEATNYIKMKQVCEFVDKLEEPLRIPAPNRIKLMSLKIPICKDDMMHCTDILDALTKYFLKTSEAPEVPGGGAITRENYEVISDTVKRMREIYSIGVIVRYWRVFVKRKKTGWVPTKPSERRKSDADDGDDDNGASSDHVTLEMGNPANSDSTAEIASTSSADEQNKNNNNPEDSVSDAGSNGRRKSRDSTILDIEVDNRLKSPSERHKDISDPLSDEEKIQTDMAAPETDAAEKDSLIRERRSASAQNSLRSSAASLAHESEVDIEPRTISRGGSPMKGPLNV